MTRSLATCLTLCALALLFIPSLARAVVWFETGDYHREVGEATLVALGDLDGDGRGEALVNDWRTGALSMLRCGADARFGPASDLGVIGARGAAIGDIDGDGRNDLVTSHDGHVEVRRQAPDGSLLPPVSHPAGPPGGFVHLVDLNRDDRLDVVIGGGVWWDTVATVLLSVGAGSFGPPATYGLGSSVDLMLVADLDGDGHLDLCVKELQRYSFIRFLKGRGDGTFEARTVLNACGFLNGFDVGDLDGDGDLDIAALGGGVHLLENDGAGNFTERGVLPVWDYYETHGSRGIAIADLDSDGRLDVIALGSAGYDFSQHDLIECHRNLGDWAFVQGPSFQTLFNTSVMMVRDVDGDGALDVVTTATGARPGNTSYRAGLTFTRGKGDGRFAGVIEYKFDDGRLGNNDQWVRLQFVPEETGRDALWMIAPTGTKVVRYADGWPTTQGRAVEGIAGPREADPAQALFGGGHPPPVLADMDGDDIPDRLEMIDVQGTLDTLLVSRGRGDGAFDPAVAHPVAPSRLEWQPNSPVGLAACDLEHDGDNDVIALGSGGDGDGSGVISVFVNAGGGALLPAVPYCTSPEANYMLVFDADRDAFPDVFVSISISGDVGNLQTFRGIGDGTIAYDSDWYWGDYPTHLATGDFDGDGLPDIAYYSYAAHTVAVGINATVDLPTPALASLVSAAFADGIAHLVWHVSGAATATIQRSDDGATWAARAQVAPDGDGRVRFDDPDMLPGHRYGWRLALHDGSTTVTTAEAWLDIPGAPALGLAGASPNPVEGDLTVALTLPSRAEATLTLFDLAGRRVASRDVGHLGAGTHRIRLAQSASLRPGLYFVRLSTREHTLIRTAVVVR